ncbi:putative lipid II flippase FtsW [Gordonia sp. FQ]|uniref:putative lipid II flippase FtsW n=1 Tax=Gordonia sp. FQ TaxID=3446634 RepID=UPI003F86457F
MPGPGSQRDDADAGIEDTVADEAAIDDEAVDHAPADHAPIDDTDVPDAAPADDVREDGAGADDAREDAAAGDDTEPAGDDVRPRRRAAAASARRRPGRAPRRSAARPLTFGLPTVDLRTWISTAREGIRTLMARPLTSFHLVVGLAAILTVFGLIMVQSASSVEGYSESHSAYGAFAMQVVFAIIGWILFYVVLRLPIRFFRRFATFGLLVSLALLILVLVPHLGVKVDGARRWFEVAGVSIQPSELAKLALCIWGAHLLASRRTAGATGKELLFPLLPVVVFMCALIILEPNLSTTIIVVLITAALLWFAGLPGPVFAGFAGFFVLAGAVAAFTAEYRAARVFSFLGSADPLDGGYQAMQAKYALANGGVFGVGLGQSTAKWNYLPNAHNDFIFAILVEETGLIGGLIVVGLFLLLAYVGMRIARRSADPFLRLLTGSITVLITAQMFINVGYVVGLLPVTGIQLPLLSQGGTSMLTMLTMLGLMASAARHEPEAVVALSGAGQRGLSRLLRLPRPAAYRAQVVDGARDRLDRRRTAGRAPEPRREQRRAPHRGGRPDARSAPRTPPLRTPPLRTPPLRTPAPRTPMDRPSAPRQQASRSRAGRVPPPRTSLPPLDDRRRAPRAAAQRSDEIHYPDRQASTRIPPDPRRSAARDRAAGSPRRTEYRHR